MLTSVLKKKIRHNNRESIASLLMVDLLSILKRDKHEKIFDSMVYIWCKPDVQITNLGGQINIRGIPYYVGFTKFANWNKIHDSRAYNHKKDLLDKVITNKDICYCICGLSQKEAHWLEAHLINALNLPLTKRGCYEYKANTLVNKRRERKYENSTNFYPVDQWK